MNEGKAINTVNNNTEHDIDTKEITIFTSTEEFLNMEWERMLRMSCRLG